MTHIAETHAGGIKVIRDRDAVQSVHRPAGVDNGSSKRVEQDRYSQLVRKRHTNRGSGLTHRIPLVDLLNRDKEVLAVLVNAGRRAVGEPDLVPLDGIARHLAGVDNVIEDDEPALVVLAR